jgi:hypothetical protein
MIQLPVEKKEVQYGGEAGRQCQTGMFQRMYEDKDQDDIGPQADETDL